MMNDNNNSRNNKSLSGSRGARGGDCKDESSCSGSEEDKKRKRRIARREESENNNETCHESGVSVLGGGTLLRWGRNKSGNSIMVHPSRLPEPEERNPLDILAEVAVQILESEFNGKFNKGAEQILGLGARKVENNNVRIKETTEMKQRREVKEKKISLGARKHDITLEPYDLEEKETEEQKQNRIRKGKLKALDCLDVDKFEGLKLEPEHRKIPDPEKLETKNVSKRRQKCVCMGVEKHKLEIESQTKSSNENGENGKKKKEYAKKADFRRLGLVPPPDLPQPLREFIELIGGKDLKLIITKQMWPTDLNTHHDRFSIPENQVQNKFLTEEEETILRGEKDVEGHKPKLKVEVMANSSLDDNDPFSKLQLTWWNRSYVLSSGWKKVVIEHGESVLKAGAIVQLWSFRMDGQLRFLLLKVHDGMGGNASDVSSRANDGGVGASGNDGPSSAADDDMGATAAMDGPSSSSSNLPPDHNVACYSSSSCPP